MPDDNQKLIKYYRPGYKAKNLAPEGVPAGDVGTLSRAFATLKKENLLNPVAEKYFLANALVEGRFSNSENGMSLGLTGVWDDSVMKQYRKMGGNTYPLGNGHHTVAFGENSDYDMALLYGLELAYKTGPYANHIYGPNATEAQRVSLWNGRGQADEILINSDGQQVTQRAHAGNHARKVIELNSELQLPHNAEMLRAFKDFQQIKVQYP